MTDAALDRQETLYVTDAELIRRLGVPERTARAALAFLDANPNRGFPKKIGLWGNRRYWPAVVAYLDRNNGLTVEPPQPPGGGHVRKAKV